MTSAPPTELERRLRVRGVTIVEKATVWHQRAIDRLLRLVSLGRMDRYLSSYVTTIGRTIYVPADFSGWPIEERAAILRHELVHVAQFERYGVVPMALAYLLFPIPVGLAWARMRLEREAYEESIRAAHEAGGRAATDALRASIIRRHTGPDYLWMWPFPRAIGRWYDRVVDELASRSRPR